MGSSGVESTLLAVVIASARSFPARTCGNADTPASNIRLTWPPMMSVSAGALPLYGMWVMSTPAIDLNISPARWIEPPWPMDAKLSLPGCAFANATSSLTDCAGTAGLTTRYIGEKYSIDTGAKSFTGS